MRRRQIQTVQAGVIQVTVPFEACWFYGWSKANANVALGLPLRQAKCAL